MQVCIPSCANLPPVSSAASLISAGKFQLLILWKRKTDSQIFRSACAFSVAWSDLMDEDFRQPSHYWVRSTCVRMQKCPLPVHEGHISQLPLLPIYALEKHCIGLLYCGWHIFHNSETFNADEHTEIDFSFTPSSCNFNVHLQSFQLLNQSIIRFLCQAVWERPQLSGNKIGKTIFLWMNRILPRGTPSATLPERYIFTLWQLALRLSLRVVALIRKKST